MSRVWWLCWLLAVASGSPLALERAAPAPHGRALLARSAAQQQCQACSTCRSPECWQTCRVYCPPTTKTPNNYVVPKGSQCMDAGAALGPTAAREACRRVMEECRPQEVRGALLGAAYGDDTIGKLSLVQCTKVAMGACQQAAGDTADEECQNAGANGFGDCAADRFTQRFHERTAEICRRGAQGITNVDPYTGNWAAREDNGYRRRLLAH